MSSASWTQQTNLSQLAPGALQTAIGGLNDALSTATSIVKGIENLVRTAEGFLTSPGDVLIAFLNNYSSAISQVVADALSLGGGFIFVTPYNRRNIRKVDILNTKELAKGNTQQVLFPMIIPVMTPQEALNEFYASFNNANDPLRPQWTTNVEVTGFGLLFTAPDPATMSQLMTALKPILNLAEVDDYQKKLTTDVTSWYDSTVNMVGADASTFLNFDISGFKIKTRTTTSADGTQTQEITQIFDDALPALHWYGLNLSNFSYLKDLEKLVKDMVNSLVAITKTVNNFIKEAADAIIRKLEVILQVVTNVIQIAEGFLVALNSTGVYFFEVPRNFGGVAYIQQAIQSSLTNPQSVGAQQVAAVLNKSNFSALFFAGASTGVNLSAWEALFKNAFNDTNFAFQSQFQAQFSVLPSFDQTVFPFGVPVQLSVVSQESTSENQLYYTYVIKDNKGNEVSHFDNFLTSNDARVNIDSFDVTFSPPVGYNTPVGTLTYSIQVVVFNHGANRVTYSKNFFVTDTLSGVDTRLDPTSPISITGGPCGGTASIVNKNVPAGGNELEHTYIAPNATVNLGTSVSPGSSNLSLRYTSSCSDGTTVDVPVVNNLGYTIGNVNALPVAHSFRFLTFPAKICFNFVGAFKYRVKGTETWTTITLPACFNVQLGVTYEYFIFTPETGWQGLFTLEIVQQAQAGTQVC